MAITLDVLNANFHSIKISDGTNDLAIDASGHISINDGGNSLTVDGTVAATQSGTWNIDTVTTLTGITNDVNIADGGNSITVDDGGASLTVDGTVAATQSGTWNIDTVTTLTGITNDVNIADGGNSITVDDGGTTLSIDDGGGSITVDGTVGTTRAGYASWQTSVVSATSTASEVAATPLSGRDKILIQNLGSQDVYVGEDNTVTTSTGFLLPKGASYVEEIGETPNIWVITNSGSADLRVVELAA